MVYLDSNVFLYTLLHDGSSNPKAQRAADILRGVEDGKARGFSSLLTWDEVVWVVWRLSGYEYALKAGASILRIPNMTFVGVDERVILRAQDLVERHRLRPRDAIHASTAMLVGEREIVSDDADFDGVRDISRVPL
jgi:predicted nucleic acid-binding protein